MPESLPNRPVSLPDRSVSLPDRSVSLPDRLLPGLQAKLRLVYDEGIADKEADRLSFAPFV